MIHAPLPNSADPAAAPADPPGIYRAGTLTYTKWGLITLCTWLLWGDFFFYLFEAVLPKLLPLQLKQIGGKNWIIGICCTTIPAAMKLVLGPVISFRSDRMRSAWGRRRPFLLIGTPLTALFLFLLGFAPQAGSALFAAVKGSVSQTTLTLGIVVLIVLAFNFFNTFITTIYLYLFNDVVPRPFLARVMALFRFVAVLAGSLFGWYVLPWVGKKADAIDPGRLRSVYMISAALLLVVFGLMSWRVKEGEYPPPKPLVDGRKGLFAAIETYLVECFTTRRYWYFFLAGTLWAIGFSITGLDMFWAQSVGADLGVYGKVNGASHLLIAVLIIPSGMLADRIHPVRVMLIAKSILVLVLPAAALLLFYDEVPRWGYAVWLTLQFVAVPMTALYKAAEYPMSMRILPHDRFGQFSSASEAIKAVALMVAGPLAFGFIDLLKGVRPTPLWEYRAVPVWAVFFYAISLVFLWLLYRDLQRDPGSGIAIDEGRRGEAACP